MPEVVGGDGSPESVAIQVRKTRTIPGLTLGVGIGSGTRDDIRSVYTIWLITSLTTGVLLFGVLSWFVRRWILKAVGYLYDARQARAVVDFRAQFSATVFRLADPMEIIPKEMLGLLATVSQGLNRSCIPAIYYLDHVEHEGRWPDSWTTFFFIGQPPLILCLDDPAEFGSYQWFQLFHEIGHGAGYQTSHSLDQIIGLTDLVLLVGGSRRWVRTIGSDGLSWPATAHFASSKQRPHPRPQAPRRMPIFGGSGVWR